MVFYNQTATADGSVVHAGKVTTDSGGSDDVLVDLPAVDTHVHSLVIVASTDGTPMADVGRLEWLISGGEPEPVARFPVTGLTTERALVLGEVYRRDDHWRLRAIGQGWEGGLAGLATDYGVTIDEADPSAGMPADPTGDAAAEPAGTAQVDSARVEPGSASTGDRPTAGPVRVVQRRVRVAEAKPVSLPPVRLAEDPGWQSSRLFSISGIGGTDEQEKRATSALLWSMAAVRPLGRALTARAGAPAGAVETFIEVGFTIGEQRVIPDGVVRISRGQRIWTALVEVKTGDGTLGREQVEAYLRLAKRRKYDAVLTISNQITTDPDLHPVEIAARPQNSVALFHISWSEVMHEIRMLLAHHRFTDPLPLWILSELDRYLEHPRSGAMPFNDMGPAWVSVREAVAAGTLRPGDRKAAPVVSAWHKLVRQLCLGLTARLGVPVKQVIPRRLQSDQNLRVEDGTHHLADHGLLGATLRVPDAAGPIGISADLRTSRVLVTVEVAAPREYSLTRRVTWLTRQLRDAPEDLLVEARFASRPDATCERLSDVRERPQVLLPGRDWEPASFVVSRSQSMGTKRSGARGSFVASVNDAVDSFYTQVIERIRPWTPPAPTLPAVEPEPQVSVPLAATPRPGPALRSR